MDMSDYPDYYPDDIPPEDASPANGSAFRFVENDPPTKHCFDSSYAENPNRKLREPSDRVCFYGTSLYTDSDEAKKIKQLFRPLRKKKLSIGTLVEEDGVMKKTRGPHHITVWFKVDSTPHVRFECIEEK